LSQEAEGGEEGGREGREREKKKKMDWGNVSAEGEDGVREREE